MAFVTSKYGAEFQELILENVQAVLERDVGTALAAIDSDLDTFKDFTTPTSIALNFPALYIEPDISTLAQADDDSYIQAEHSILINLSIVARDPDVTKQRIVKYVRAVDQAIRTMSVIDLTGGVDSATGKPAWEVVEHRYGSLEQNADRTIYRRDAQLVMVVQILER